MDLRNRIAKETADLEPSSHAFARTVAKAHRRSRRRAIVGVSVGVLATVILATGLWQISTTLPTGRVGHATTGATDNLRAEVSPPASISLAGAEFLDSVSDGTSLWILVCDDGCAGEARDSSGRVVAFDIATGDPRAEISVAHPSQFAVGGDSVWLTQFWTGSVVRIDQATQEPIATIQLALPTEWAPGDRLFTTSGMAVGHERVWVSSARGAVAVIEEATNRVAHVITAPPEGPGQVLATPDAVWVGEQILGVTRIDPATLETATFPIEDGASTLSAARMAYGADSVWVVGEWARDGELTGDGAVVRLDPTTGKTEATRAVAAGSDITFADDALWVMSADRRSVSRLDPATNQIGGAVAAPDNGQFVGAAGGFLWYVEPGGSVRRTKEP